MTKFGSSARNRKSGQPPIVVLVLMVHQSFRMNNVGQFGGQQAVVSVDGRQTLVLQLKTKRLAALSVDMKADDEVQ